MKQPTPTESSIILIYLDLLINLALLVALTAVSGFIDKRWSHQTLSGRLLQGLLIDSDPGLYTKVVMTFYQLNE